MATKGCMKWKIESALNALERLTAAISHPTEQVSMQYSDSLLRIDANVELLRTGASFAILLVVSTATVSLLSMIPQELSTLLLNSLVYKAPLFSTIQSGGFRQRKISHLCKHRHLMPPKDCTGLRLRYFNKNKTPR